MTEDIKSAIARLETWVNVHEFQGYDPFDGLSSWVRPLAAGKTGRQALLQLVRRCPVNLRPALGIHPGFASKAMGFFARAYLKLHQTTDEKHWIGKAIFCLEWLEDHPSQSQPGLSWGNHFDYQSRAFYLPGGEPTVVWSALIGQAFVDAYEVTKEARYLEVAGEVTHFILEGLERRRQGKGVCISYIPSEFIPIHNSNMLAAGFLARVHAFTAQDDLRRVAADAVAYTVGAQLSDGSWWYGEDPKYHWVDNWHTAYVLDSLWWYIHVTGDTTHARAFSDGVRFWLANFFLENGTPRYYPDKTYPIDIQCVAQAIESLCLYSQTYDASCLVLADKVARWAIFNMQDADGHFYFQRTPRWVNKTPMLHWGQATMLHALSCLLSQKESNCRTRISRWQCP